MLKQKNYGGAARRRDQATSARGSPSQRQTVPLILIPFSTRLLCFPGHMTNVSMMPTYLITASLSPAPVMAFLETLNAAPRVAVVKRVCEVPKSFFNFKENSAEPGSGLDSSDYQLPLQTSGIRTDHNLNYGIHGMCRCTFRPSRWLHRPTFWTPTTCHKPHLKQSTRHTVNCKANYQQSQKSMPHTLHYDIHLLTILMWCSILQWK